MNRYAIASILCLFACALWCADPGVGDIVPTASAAPASGPWWASLVTTIVTLVLLPFLKQYLTAHADAADAQAKLHEIDASKSLIEQKGIIMDRLKAYLWGSAAAIAEKRFPDLARLVIAGHLDADAIKTELRHWGADLKAEAIFYFKGQGIDLVQTFGVVALDGLIERAANAVSPFPGKDTAEALLKDGIAPLLIDKGVEYMKAHSLGQILEPARIATDESVPQA
jgi:hypothetical protein